MSPKKPIVINFDSNTVNKVYSLTLKTMKDCILTIGALDATKLEQLRKETLFLLWEIEALQSEHYATKYK